MQRTYPGDHCHQFPAVVVSQAVHRHYWFQLNLSGIEEVSGANLLGPLKLYECISLFNNSFPARMLSLTPSTYSQTVSRPSPDESNVLNMLSAAPIARQRVPSPVQTHLRKLSITG